MRRTRGDMARFFFWDAALCAEPFEARALFAAEDFAGEVLPEDVLPEEGLAGVDLGLVESCCERLRAAEAAPIQSPQSASTRHHLKPTRTTFTIFRAETRRPELVTREKKYAFKTRCTRGYYLRKFPPITERSSSARLRTTSF